MTAALDIFKALSDDVRLRMAAMLAARGEMSCKELSAEFDLSQPALSHHFNKLMDAGAVLMRKEGTQCFYKLNAALLQKRGIDIRRALQNK